MDSGNLTNASALNTSLSESSFGNNTIGDLSEYERVSIYIPWIAIIEFVCVPLWLAIGIPGNVLSFVVWNRSSMKASSGCILTALSAIDLLFLVLRLLYELQETWHYRLLEVSKLTVKPAAHVKLIRKLE
jgi:hypothetical protein